MVLSHLSARSCFVNSCPLTGMLALLARSGVGLHLLKTVLCDSYYVYYKCIIELLLNSDKESCTWPWEFLQCSITEFWSNQTSESWLSNIFQTAHAQHSMRNGSFHPCNPAKKRNKRKRAHDEYEDDRRFSIPDLPLWSAFCWLDCHIHNPGMPRAPSPELCKEFHLQDSSVYSKASQWWTLRTNEAFWSISVQIPTWKHCIIETACMNELHYLMCIEDCCCSKTLAFSMRDFPRRAFSSASLRKKKPSGHRTGFHIGHTLEACKCSEPNIG
mgnify:CR=1 FL=1